MEKNFVYINYSFILFNETSTILQLCSKMSLYLPRFCYHPTLPIAANCRMCLVQLEESSKPIAACAVSTAPGMRILTETTLVKQARENVLEFLLINHPLDCPICDQGGECDLQDQTMVFGSDRGRFYEKKRAVKDNIALGHVIKTFMTRCIHCTRCVRFVQDLIGSNELGVIGRGNNMRITTFVVANVNSNLSGNLADICPVGALTSKPYAFTARPWELVSHFTIDLFDAVGGNLRTDTRGSEIMRILPYSNKLVNQEWATDKARLAFDGFLRQRLKKPILLRNIKLPYANSIYLGIRQAVHIVKSKFIAALVAVFMNTSITKLSFTNTLFISPIADFKTSLASSFLLNFNNHEGLNQMYDMHNNITLVKNNAVNLSRSYFFSAMNLDVINQFQTISFVAFDIQKEAPLLYISINNTRTNSERNFMQLTTKLDNNVMEKGIKKSNYISSKSFTTMLYNVNTTWYLLGQACLCRDDFGSIFNILQQKQSKFTVFPATTAKTAELEIN